MAQRLVIGAVAFLLGFAVLVGCPVPPKPTPQPTAADAGGCEPACIHLRAKHCLLGEPTSRGVTCEALCSRVLEENGGLGFPTDCLIEAGTCEAADRCR